MLLDDLGLKWQQEEDPRAINLLTKIEGRIASLLESFTNSSKVDTQIKGKVSVTDMPPVGIKGPVSVSNLSDIKIPSSIEIKNFSELSDQFEKLRGAFVTVAQTLKVAPPTSKLPTKFTISDFDILLEDMEELKKGIQLLINKETDEKGIAQAVEITNFPPQMVPQPVTHISINSLQGFIKTSATTITSTLTTLPGYGVLADRRALYIYNNSSNTVFVGGSDVTTANGIPVPPSSTSPIISAGDNVIMYGIAASGNNNVRVMEVSDEASGR